MDALICNWKTFYFFNIEFPFSSKTMNFSNETRFITRYKILIFEFSDQCIQLHIFAFIELLLFFVCVVFNSVLLKIFIHNKKLRTKFTKLIIVLTVNNLVGSFFVFPFAVLSKFYCKWAFGQFGCVFVGTNTFLSYF